MAGTEQTTAGSFTLARLDYADRRILQYPGEAHAWLDANCGADAWAIVGVMGLEGEGFQIEVRLNRVPLPETEMAGWIETLLGLPAVYAPLPPFV